MTDTFNQLARLWRDSAIRPRVANQVLLQWDKVIDEWIAAEDLPLLVRKFGPDGGRGSVIRHTTGREIVPTDNTPANWSLALALNEKCPSITEIRALVESGNIPVAMAFKRAERAVARFIGTRAASADLNALGWKVCHKTSIGGVGRGSLSQLPIDVLVRHFRAFLAPSNMFLVPKSRAGLGELPEVTAAMRGEA